MRISYILGSILLLLIGIWLIVSAIHIVLAIIGWILLVAAAVALVKVLFFHATRGGPTAVD